MSKKTYVSPRVDFVGDDEIDAVVPLMMSGSGGGAGGGGGGGGGGVIPATYETVRVVNNPAFFFGMAGHSALLLEDSDGSVTLYSFHPISNSNPDEEGSIAQIANPEDGRSFGAFKRACLEEMGTGDTEPGILVDNGNHPWHEGFRRALILRVSSESAAYIRAYANREAQSPRRYNLALYNCQVFVNSALAAGGIVLGAYTLGVFGPCPKPIVPNSVYDTCDAYRDNEIRAIRKVVF